MLIDGGNQVILDIDNRHPFGLASIEIIFGDYKWSTPSIRAAAHISFSRLLRTQ